MNPFMLVRSEIIGHTGYSKLVFNTNRGCCGDKIGVVTLEKKRSLDGRISITTAAPVPVCC